MPFEKGQSGNAEGRPVSQKAFANMLRLAINEAVAEGGTKLRQVASALVDKAISGDVPAIREIADRLDGKVAQQLNHANESGNGPAEFIFKTVYEQAPDAND